MTQREAPSRQTGSEVLEHMRKFHIPVTRQNYLELLYGVGNIPEEIPPEVEREMPQSLRIDTATQLRKR
jgi:hypothetical protein